MDRQFGLIVYNVRGTVDGSTIELAGDPTQAPNGTQYGTIHVKGALTPEGNLQGQWSSSLGTGGTFVLFPHDQPAQNRTSNGLLPERLHTATRAIGAVRLYAPVEFSIHRSGLKVSAQRVDGLAVGPGMVG
jgi:hypothetical protein